MRGEVIGYGTIRDGRLHPTTRPAFPASWEGQHVRVGVSLADGEKVSGGARGYYWSVILPAFAAYMREEGDGDADAERAHEVLSHLFLSIGPCPITGVPRRRSTSTLTAEEFRAYLDERVLPYLGIECALEIPEADPAKRSPRRRRELAKRDEMASRGALSATT